MQAIEQDLVDTKMQFVDSTHVKAHANRHKNHKQETVKKAKAYQRQLEKEIDLDRKIRGKKEFKAKEKEESNPRIYFSWVCLQSETTKMVVFF